MGLVKPYSYASILSFALTLCGGFAAYFYPNLRDGMGILVWAIPAAVFLGTLIVGFFLAPYYIYEETHTKIKRLEAIIDKQNNSEEKIKQLNKLADVSSLEMVAPQVV